MLDNIATDDFGQFSRAAVVRVCQKKDDGFLSSVQIGLSQGTGTPVRWSLVHGTDNNAVVDRECLDYELEKDCQVVRQIEIGYLDDGQPEDQGVIWLNFLLRYLEYNSTDTTDVVFDVGRKSKDMKTKTLSFDQSNPFIGFWGRSSRRTSLPLVTLGAVTFDCRQPLIFPSSDDDETWRGRFSNFYDDYDILIWIIIVIVISVPFCVVAICFYMRLKKRQNETLRQMHDSIKRQNSYLASRRLQELENTQRNVRDRLNESERVLVKNQAIE